MLSDEGLIKTTEKLLKEQPEIFDALLEFEKTGRVPKFTHKKRVNFTIDAELVKKLRKYCQTNGKKMSTFIEGLIRNEIKN